MLRDYRPGEEAREIDWRASARCGTLQIRERDRDVPLTWSAIVDRSLSMSVGRRRSLQASAHEAMQAWRTCLGPDDRWKDVRVKTKVFAPAYELESALRQLPRGAALLVVSDFYELGFVGHTLLRTLARRFDCTALIARDPWFEEFPLQGFIQIVDAENSACQEFYVGPRERARYRIATAAREAEIMRVFEHTGWRAAVLEEHDGTSALLRAFELA